MTDKNFVTIKFTRQHKCYEAGMKKDVTPEFAHALIEYGVAKRVKAPKRDKQISEPTMEKSL